jgi:nucleotidyltransferase substrate binding protein (TIGR01987 family)
VLTGGNGKNKKTFLAQSRKKSSILRKKIKNDKLTFLTEASAMTLDVSSMRNALTALKKSLKFLTSDMANDPDLREQFRAAAIQAFEFTHELAFKMLKRQIEQITADPAAVDRMGCMEIIRTGAEAGLITDVARYCDYREKRKITSHTYDQAKAEQIVSVLKDFRDDVRYLLVELEQRNRA